jgi:putative FmdB family regulatory protein
MPIYEYRRPNGTTFEVMQKFSDDALTVDPDTGVPVQRVLHAPAIHFKGKGFHNTDYGTKRRNRELEKSAQDGASKTESKSSEKKESSKSSDSSSSSSSSSSEKKDKKKAA